MHFSDDLFFIRNSYGWLEEFAELYPQEVGLPWNCNIRYDSVNQHAADLLEKAMCYGAAVGLESGNERIREIVIKKRSKNDHIVEGARLLREKRIKVLTTNMIGLPGETLDNALETVQLNMELKSDYVRANTFLLFPGLPLVEYSRQNGLHRQGLRHRQADRGVAGDHAQDAVRARVPQHRVALLADGEVSTELDAVSCGRSSRCPTTCCSASSARSTCVRNCSSTGCGRFRRFGISKTPCS